MSVLEKNTSWIKKFLHGDGGYAHAAQELILWGIGWVIMYLISPLFGLVLIFVGKTYGTKYWYAREITQYRRWHKNKSPGHISLWTEDSRADVETPEKARYIWYAITVVLALVILNGVGLTGYIFWSMTHGT